MEFFHLKQEDSFPFPDFDKFHMNFFCTYVFVMNKFESSNKWFCSLITRTLSLEVDHEILFEKGSALKDS